MDKMQAARAAAREARGLREDRIAIQFAPHWALGEDARQWIIFEQMGSNRYDARSFYNQREPLIERMSEKPDVFPEVLDWLRGLLGPFHGCGRWFYDLKTYNPRRTIGLLPFPEALMRDRRQGDQGKG